MKRALITTTIYPPQNLIAWAQYMRQGDIIVVSGDVKTPHNKVRNVLNAITEKTGIHTTYVVETDTRTSHTVPMCSIQRRNVAILEAIRMNADMITTVDTDNYPLVNSHDTAKFGYFGTIERMFAKPWIGDVVGSTTGWTNVGEWCEPHVLYRGWPLGVQSHHYSHSHNDVQAKTLRIGVHSSLWLGDPDISAMERLLSDPCIDRIPDHPVVLEPGVWCPFNSQATTYRRELLPLLNVWPGVGRMDDIWPSYVARYVMDHLNYAIAYGTPNVRQDRHDHDIVTDLENEILGYRYTREFLSWLQTINLSGISDAFTCLEHIFAELQQHLRHNDNSILPDITYNFWHAWIADLCDVYTDQFMNSDHEGDVLHD